MSFANDNNFFYLWIDSEIYLFQLFSNKSCENIKLIATIKSNTLDQLRIFGD